MALGRKPKDAAAQAAREAELDQKVAAYLARRESPLAVPASEVLAAVGGRRQDVFASVKRVRAVQRAALGTAESAAEAEPTPEAVQATETAATRFPEVPSPVPEVDVAAERDSFPSLQREHTRLAAELARLERRRTALELERERVRAARFQTREHAHARVDEVRAQARAGFAASLQELRLLAAVEPAKVAGAVAAAFERFELATVEPFWQAVHAVIDAPPGAGYAEQFADPQPGRVEAIDAALAALAEERRLVRERLKAIPAAVARAADMVGTVYEEVR